MIEVWSVVSSVLVLFALAVYYYGFWNLNCFKDHGIPCLPPVPFLGNMAQSLFRRKSFGEILSLAYNIDRDAKYVGFFEFARPIVILRDPELIKSVAIKNFDHFPDHKMFSDEIPDPILKNSLFGLQGQRWRDARTLLTPSFTSSKMKMMFQLMKQCTITLIEHMKTESIKSTVFEMRDVLSRHTNDVIATTAFGISIDSQKDRENELLIVGRKSADFSGTRSLKLFIFRTFPNIAKLLGMNLFGEKIAKFYKNIIEATVAVREAKGIVRPDMLQLMMQAKDPSKNSSQKMTSDDMVPHAFIFYFGGFDSSSNLMCFVLHEIAVNPEVHERLQAEIDEELERCNGDVTYDALQGMEYMDAVIHETLRLHSPIAFMDRKCRHRFELPPAKPGLKPFTIEQEASIGLPIAAIHLDPDHFPNPYKFDPERFIGSRKNDIDRAAFIPFGIGPRVCIGSRFVLMETKLVIFELLANFNFSKCSKTVDPLKLDLSSFMVIIDGGVWLQVEPRI